MMRLWLRAEVMVERREKKVVLEGGAEGFK